MNSESMNYLSLDGLHIGMSEAGARFAVKERFGDPVLKKKRMGEKFYELSLASRNGTEPVRLHFVKGGHLTHIQGGEIAAISPPELISKGEKVTDVTGRLGRPAALDGNAESGVLYYRFGENVLGLHYKQLKITSLELFALTARNEDDLRCSCRLPNLPENSDA